AHNILKVAGIRQLLSEKNRKKQKGKGEKRSFFSLALFFRTYRTAPFYRFRLNCVSAIRLEEELLKSVGFLFFIRSRRGLSLECKLSSLCSFIGKLLQSV